MGNQIVDDVIRNGIEEGWLPPAASSAMDPVHPWPVLVLTALGAWLSAIPLAAFLGLLFGRVLEQGPVAYVLGAALLAGSVVVFRRRQIPLFIEQSGLPALIVGLALVGYGLSKDLRLSALTAVLSVVVAVIACVVTRNWLRFLLGVTIATLISISISADTPGGFGTHNADLFSWYVIAGIWLGLTGVQHAFLARGIRAHTSAWLEAVSGGIAIATSCALAFYSGTTFMVGAIVENNFLFQPAMWMHGPGAFVPYLSVVLSLVAASAVALRWPTLRSGWYLMIVLPLGALAYFVPSLGALLVVLAFSATSGRRGLASLAALAAVWAIGSFYYQFQFPLATKAALLAGIGAMTAAVARFAIPAAKPGQASSAQNANAQPGQRRALPAIMICGVLVLAAVNAAIWQKESIIREGRPVFVELAPADPRSLVQGDFMRLNFAIPVLETAASTEFHQRLYVVARPDKRGIAGGMRFDDGSPLRPGEIRIELVPKDHRLVLVTDAWFFAEGEAGRWSQARYGEFRVDDEGRALLVGLRGPQLEQL